MVEKETLHLALFDLDNTLLDGDSDLEWGELLAESGAMDVERMRAYHDDYHAGSLDIDAFLHFQLEPLAREPIERLLAWRERFVSERIRPRILRGARDLVAQHANANHELALITATNAFLTAPIARELCIPNLIATEPEMRAGRFTGRVSGPPCYREGKIAKLEAWLATRGLRLSDVRESWFYSDSHNDIPLLLRVDHPIAIDPDSALADLALREGWKILRWRRRAQAFGT